MNIIDFFIIIILIVFAVDGYRRGAIRLLLELIVTIISIILSLLLYIPVGNLLKNIFGGYELINQGIALITIWIIFKLIFSIPYYRYLKKNKETLEKSNLDCWFGLTVALLKLIVVLGLFFASVNAIPAYKTDQEQFALLNLLSNSGINKVTSPITEPITEKITQSVKNLFSQGLELINQNPIIGEQSDLGFSYDKGTIDNAAEQEMFKLVNQERVGAGLNSLVWDENLAVLAREHSQDMLKRGYFEHNTPEGKSPFDRMLNAGIQFSSAGENLALAPTVEEAMKGLMASTGHRANILSKDYKSIGIGTINAGKYGEMFTQTFANLEIEK